MSDIAFVYVTLAGVSVVAFVTNMALARRVDRMRAHMQLLALRATGAEYRLNVLIQEIERTIPAEHRERLLRALDADTADKATASDT